MVVGIVVKAHALYSQVVLIGKECSLLTTWFLFVTVGYECLAQGSPSFSVFLISYLCYWNTGDEVNRSLSFDCFCFLLQTDLDKLELLLVGVCLQIKHCQIWLISLKGHHSCRVGKTMLSIGRDGKVIYIRTLLAKDSATVCGCLVTNQPLKVYPTLPLYIPRLLSTWKKG